MTVAINPTNSGGSGSIAELRGYLLRYARLQLRNDAMAEDVVQDTLMVVHERAADFRGESQHRTWAMGVLKNKIIDCFRRRQATVSLDAAESGIDVEFEGCFVADGHWREEIPRWQTPHGQLERDQLRAALEACLQRLPPNTARVFMLRERLGWRLPALALFVVNLVAVISYPGLAEAAVKEHFYWGALIAVLVIFGHGRWSLDAWLKHNLRTSRA